MAVYTPNDIQRIHARGTAKHNQVYVSTSGLSYIGLPNGRLKLQEEAENVEFNSITELPGDNVQQATELTVAYINAQLTNYVPKTRRLTINGTTYDLSADRSWTVSGSQDLQNVYDNSTTPEILTDSTRGAVTFKRGSAADTDDIIKGLNGAGTKKFSVTGNGKIFTGSETASRIASINANQEIESLDTTTYPSLNDLTYVKGGGTRMYAYQNTTQTVTGTVAETIMCSLALPIMGANDGLRFESMVASLGAGGVKDFKMYIGPTNNSLVGATQIGVLQHSTGTRLSAFVRHFVNKNSVSTNQIRSTTASLANDYNDANGNFNTVDINIDMSTQKYFMISVTPVSAADTSTLRNVQVYWNRA